MCTHRTSDRRRSRGEPSTQVPRTAGRSMYSCAIHRQYHQSGCGPWRRRGRRLASDARHCPGDLAGRSGRGFDPLAAALRHIRLDISDLQMADARAFRLRNNRLLRSPGWRRRPSRHVHSPDRPLARLHRGHRGSPGHDDITVSVFLAGLLGGGRDASRGTDHSGPRGAA